jgi:hypothetical protein
MKLRTPNSELRTLWERDPKLTTLPLTLDEVLSQVQYDTPRKLLFWGEGVGRISSYVAGWMAGKGIDVIVLDGANRFDPYMVSSFAKKASMPPVSLLKRIRIARAFTCYQMATLIEERLVSLLKQKGEITQLQKPWVILLGLITPFLDEDVSEREVRPLFEKSLRKVEGMAAGGVPFFLFQPSAVSENNPPTPPLVKGGKGGFMDSKRAYLTRRLFQFSDLMWRVCQDDEGPKVVLEKIPKNFSCHPELGSGSLDLLV